jgi:guanylate kinase
MTYPSSSSGLLFVLSAPAGTGKTTLAEKLVTNMPRLIESVSYTTRPPRNNEIDGIHYFFISKETFEIKIAEGEFLEYAEVFGHYYGTSKNFVQRQIENGKHILLVIDTQGAVAIKQKRDSILIFLAPPSLDVLKQRLLHRSTESFEEMQKRLAQAEHELAQMKFYDYCIVNDSLETAYDALRAIIIAEEHRIR